MSGNYPAERFTTEGTCKADDCQRDVFSRQMCRYHYDKQRAETPRSCVNCNGKCSAKQRLCSTCYSKVDVPEDKQCVADGCQFRMARNGVCHTHAYRMEKYGSLELPPLDQRPRKSYTKQPLMERFMNFVNDTGDCWLWTGAINKKTGYAHMTLNGSSINSHRVSHMLFKGEIPPGLTIDHLCRVRHCVNPMHLEAVTHAENISRSPIHVAVLNAAKTHCIRGHEFDEQNTRWNEGHRQCRACGRARWHARKAA